MKTKESISIFTYAFNEEKSVGKVIEDSLKVLKELTNDYEVIVIDDGSKDRTGAVAEEWAKKDKHIKVIHHIVNRGVGQALRTGFANAAKNLIFPVPGDGQQDISEIRLYLQQIEGADIVAGYRGKRVDPFMRTLNAKIYNLALMILFGIRIRDVDWVHLYRRRIFDKIRLETSSAFVYAEIFIKAKKYRMNVCEVAVKHRPRIAGKATGGNLKVVFRQLKEVFKFWIKWVFKG